MLIKFDTREFTSKTDKLLGSVRSATGTLKPLVESGRLNEIFGKYSRMTIEAQKYAPLTKRYERRKFKIYGRKKILERRHDGMIKGLFSGQSFEFRAQGGGRLISVSLSSPIARYHQSGAGNLPRRPVIESSPELANEIGQELSLEIGKQLKRDIK